MLDHTFWLRSKVVFKSLEVRPKRYDDSWTHYVFYSSIMPTLSSMELRRNCVHVYENHFCRVNGAMAIGKQCHSSGSLINRLNGRLYEFLFLSARNKFRIQRWISINWRRNSNHSHSVERSRRWRSVTFLLFYAVLRDYFSSFPFSFSFSILSYFPHLTSLIVGIPI